VFISFNDVACSEDVSPTKECTFKTEAGIPSCATKTQSECELDSNCTGVYTEPPTYTETFLCNYKGFKTEAAISPC